MNEIQSKACNLIFRVDSGIFVSACRFVLQRGNTITFFLVEDFIIFGLLAIHVVIVAINTTDDSVARDSFRGSPSNEETDSDMQLMQDEIKD